MTSLTVETILVTVALLAGLPLLTLVHELGHGVAAALLIGGRVTVWQGPEPARLALSLPRLDLRLAGPVAPHRVWVGWARWGPHPDRRRHVVATAAGPAASAAAAGLAALGSAQTAGLARLVLFLLALAAACQVLSSSLPVRYGRFFGCFAGEASDGLRIRRLLEGRPEPAPSVTGGSRRRGRAVPAPTAPAPPAAT